MKTLICLILAMPIFVSAQNVGVGTDVPEKQLHVETTDANDGIRITQNGVGIQLDLDILAAGAGIGTSSAHPLELRTSAQPRLTIASDGKVAVGNTPHSEMLNVNGAIRIGSTASTNEGTLRYLNNKFEGYNGTEWISMLNLWEQHANGLHTSENVAINTTPKLNDELYVNGNIRAGARSNFYSAKINYLNNVYSGGVIHLDDGISSLIPGNSDQRLRVEIKANKVLPNFANSTGDRDPVIRLFDANGNADVELEIENGTGIVKTQKLDVSNEMRVLDGANRTLNIEPDVFGSSRMTLWDGSDERIIFYGKEGNTQGASVHLFDDDNVKRIELDADYNGKGRIITDEIEIKAGSDFAEMFDIKYEASEIVPGMVVSINPDEEGKLQLTTQAYDAKVAGVISGANGVRPGMMMGQENTLADGAYPVALTGRVYVLVSEENGPIKVGDMLTTSTKAGYAMRASDRDRSFGSILGKAMTSSKSTSPYVLMLINLQ